MKYIVSRFFLIAVVMNSFLIAEAQKLPNIQKSSIRAPEGVNINGKTNEWEHAYGGFNSNIFAFYTISNDDDYLYLVVHSANQVITKKILSGGIVFTINTKKKSTDGAASITYPVLGTEEFENIVLKNSALHSLRQAGDKDDEKTKAGILRINDSISREMDKKNLASFKVIGLTGIPQVPERFISIYNDFGIEVGRQLLDSRTYNYELRIPLKYLGLSTFDEAPLFYNIKLPGTAINKGLPPLQLNGTTRPPLGEGGVDLRTLNSVSDFWGEYRLAKN